MSAFTDKLKAPIACPYCNIQTCLSCMKKCTLMWASGPKCAGCSKSFTTDFIDSTFTRGFRRGPLRIQSTSNLVEQEMSLLPQTMLVLQERKNAEMVRRYTELIIEMQTVYAYDPWNTNYAKFLEEHSRLHDDIIKLEPIGLHIKKRKTESQKKSVKCPRESCLGFIYMSGAGAGTCALCEMQVCKECNVGLADKDIALAHVCNPDDVASWTTIRDTSVPCPKCGTPIQKVSGCNQMWCTVKDCNTAFDWATGRIVNGPFHNPHYHEWLRNGGAEALQGVGVNNANLECLGPRDILSNENIGSVYNFFDFSNGYEVTKKWTMTYRALNEYLRCMAEAVDLWRWNRTAEAYNQRSHEDLRIDYLQKKIDRAAWASKMSQRETLRTKGLRFQAIHAMLQTAMADLFAQFLTTLRKMSLDNVISKDHPLSQVRRRTTRIIDPEAARPIVESFTLSINNLRVYHIKESLRIVSDYSDATVRVMDFDDDHRLLWANRSIKQLKDKYCGNQIE